MSVAQITRKQQHIRMIELEGAQKDSRFSAVWIADQQVPSAEEHKNRLIEFDHIRTFAVVSGSGHGHQQTRGGWQIAKGQVAGKGEIGDRTSKPRHQQQFRAGIGEPDVVLGQKHQQIEGGQDQQPVRQDVNQGRMSGKIGIQQDRIHE